jgi:hypothetical protein
MSKYNSTGTVNATPRNYIYDNNIETFYNAFCTERRCKKCKSRLSRSKNSGEYICMRCGDRFYEK